MRGRSLDAARELMATRGLPGAELERPATGSSPATGPRPRSYPRSTPAALGQILALYEHRVFVEGVVLGINAFDQWGVELGKELATQILPVLETGEGLAARDGSTRMLVEYLRDG
jgi:glucose-6-phosphate isomerase